MKAIIIAITVGICAFIMLRLYLPSAHLWVDAVLSLAIGVAGGRLFDELNTD